MIKAVKRLLKRIQIQDDLIETVGDILWYLSQDAQLLMSANLIEAIQKEVPQKTDTTMSLFQGYTTEEFVKDWRAFLNVGKTEEPLIQEVVMFGSILHKEWTAPGDKKDIICHTWAEDGSIVEFIVPEPLRDELVHMQNRLSQAYQRIAKLRAKLTATEKAFDDLFDFAKSDQKGFAVPIPHYDEE